jgi:type II secretion system protein H
MMTFRTGNKITRRSKRASAGGFTLIELILVMVLLVVVIAISAPSLSKFFHGRTLNSEARQFVSLTRYAQSRAVSEGIPMELWIDPRRGIYGLRQQAGYDAQDPKAVELDLDENLSIQVMDIAPANSRNQQSLSDRQNPNQPIIRFLPTGRVSESSPQTILISEGKKDEVWIQQSWNGLNYSIETNAIHQVYR